MHIYITNFSIYHKASICSYILIESSVEIHIFVDENILNSKIRFNSFVKISKP